MASFKKLRDETQKNKPNTNKYRLRYHFKDTTLNMLDENVERISMILQKINLETQISVQKDVIELMSIIQRIRDNQVSSMVRAWLKAPDATVDHNNIRAKHCEGTGLWLFQDRHYTQWMNQDNSLLCISGFAGIGKSVLCSTAITYISDLGKKENGIALGFFYFQFDDASKQSDSLLIKSLLLQHQVNALLVTGFLSDYTSLLTRETHRFRHA